MTLILHKVHDIVYLQLLIVITSAFLMIVVLMLLIQAKYFKL